MEREDWLELNVRALGDWFRVVSAGRALSFEGVVAGVAPQVPGRSVFNSVVYADSAAFETRYEEIAASYTEAGCAWTVWVREDDTRTAALLSEAGHVLDAQPRAMGADLAALEEGAPEGIDLSADGTLEEMFAINDRAYGWPPGTWEAGLGTLPEPSFVYVARLGGEPVATALTTDHPGLEGTADCSVWCVGTLEAARGKGLATALMRRAMIDARGRGCATTTLQATKLGRPVYERVGYGDFGAIQMWELRPPHLASDAQPKPAA